MGFQDWCGAEDRVRTGDPTLFRRMLYQLSYLGIYLFETRNAALQLLRFANKAGKRPDVRLDQVV